MWKDILQITMNMNVSLKEEFGMKVRKNANMKKNSILAPKEPDMVLFDIFLASYFVILFILSVAAFVNW